jgi:hypothetical protein
MADDLGREAVAVVRVGWPFHLTSLAGHVLLGHTQLTRDDAVSPQEVALELAA